jgi:ABC-type transporter Mla subunit MlaD
MALTIEAIQERKVALEGDLTKLRDTIAQLDAKRQELVNNLNALHGAVQQCDQFLVDIAEQEEPKTKKKNENI